MRYYFVIGNGAQAHRGEIIRKTDKLIFIKVYSGNTSSMKVYQKDKIKLVESW